MKKYTIIFMLIFALNMQAQQGKKDSHTFLDKTEFKVGYYGNLLWDNGLNLGAEYALKELNGSQRTIKHQFLLNGSLGYSTNFSNKTDNGLHTYYGFIWRMTTPKRWQMHIELNPLGYYRSFLSETFKVEEGKVSKVWLPGRGYYTPTIAVGLGRLGKGKRRSGWYLNFNCAFRTNYNAGLLSTYSFQIGHRFNFKNKKR